LDARQIDPIISTFKISGAYDNYYELSALDSKGINIDWDKTTWYIYDGHENVVKYKGATISHAFIRKQDAMGYPVLVEMFLKGSTIPFTGYKTINIEGDELKPVIGYSRTPDKANSIDFNASSSRGNNIKWSHTVWTFGDGTAPLHGAVVNHTYPLATTKTTYRVSCTITRINSLGQEEQATIYKEINIAQDRIRPVVYAKVIDDTLILSAEDSEGSGLMLDRSIWNFPGEGDSVSDSQQTYEGVVKNTSNHISGTVSFTNSWGTGTGTIPKNSLTVGAGYSYDWGETDSSGQIVNDNSFSSQNSHVGISCRRSIRDNQTTQLVALTVYRITEDGVQAETITVNINLDKARSGATFQ
jgi:hypothetical protein